MRKFKAFVSYIMIVAMLITLIPLRPIMVNAAVGSNLSVLSYRYNSSSTKYELTLTWQGSKATKNASITYHDDVTSATYTTPSVSVTQIQPININTAKFSATFDVSRLKDDFLYDIKLNMLDATNSSVGTANIYFITGMSFESERVEPPVVPGVFESGTSPELKLTWKVPRVFKDTSWVMVTDPTALTAMNAFLGLTGTDILTKLDFKINISTKAQTLDSGADISPITISDSAGYKANCVSSTGKAVLIDANDYMSINVVGRKDLQETPTVDPAKLYHSQIQPGTVYFMNVKLAYTNANNEKVDAFSLGDPSQYNGSLVKDKASGLGYTYTPIRFKITRDVTNNIYVTAYRINKDDGSLDMPSLYYSIQAIDTPISTYGVDWPEKARMTDQFFPSGSKYAVTVITGVDANTPMYYKVVVKTDSKTDRIESLKMLYQMSVDTSKPPIPINVKVDATQNTLVTGNVNNPQDGTLIKDSSGNPLNVKSTDIVLTWDKPSNFESLSPAEKKDLMFNVVINRNVEDLNSKYPLKYAGLESEYLVNYRWVKSFSAADATVVDNKLTYKIKGFELFKYVDSTTTPTNTVYNLNNPDKYPNWLIENTIYYLKMFTTKTYDGSVLKSITDLSGDTVINYNDFVQKAGTNAETIVSQPSVVTSFTTLPSVDKQVPVPTGFKVIGENIDTVTMKNYVNLQFDRASIDWDTYTSTGGNKEYYDLFMASGSTDNPQFFQIGSTDTTFTPSVPDYPNKAQITMVNGVWSVKVPGLKPNTMYRFKLRLRLVFGNTAITPMTSDYTAIVSATTRKFEILTPDPNTKIPMAPVDFKIAKNSDGTDDLTGAGVGLDWSILEDDVTYQLVVTTNRIDLNVDIPTFQNDAYYQSFIKIFNIGSNDKVLALDPKAAGGRFNTDLIKKICKYNVDPTEKFMTANNVYYYSLRAVRSFDSNGNPITPLPSQWVTIPVTTSLIDAPLDLEVVMDYEIGTSWTDTTTGVKAEDYTIYMKKSSESEYKALGITQATITQDPKNLNKFYARMRGLSSGTSYDLQAHKGVSTDSVKIVNLGSFTTRDEYHSIEVRWKGNAGFTYEIALKAEGTDDYTKLTGKDITTDNTEDKVNNFFYKSEKTSEVANTNYSYYYAKIKSMPIKLSDGTTQIIDLSSNTKYYVKVKAIQNNPSAESKYIGPVTARTSFKQSEYDNKEKLEETTAKLVDKIDKIEQTPYYNLNYVLTTTNTYLLKADKLGEELKASPKHELKVDLVKVSSAGRKDIVYIPEYLAQTLRDSNGAISFVLDKSEFTLLSSVLDENLYTEAAALRKKYSEKELWYKLEISRPESGTEGLEATITPVSQVSIPQLEILGVSNQYSTLKKDFVDKVYNSETGLVKKKKDQLKDLYKINPNSLAGQGDYLIDTLVADVEKELSEYVNTTINGGNGKTGIILGSSLVNELAAPMIAKINVNTTDGYCQPYGLYMDGHTWNKLTALNNSNGFVSFEIVKPGKYFVGSNVNFVNSISKNHWAYYAIVKFNNLYNLADVFNATGDFNADSPMSLKSSILIMDKMFNKESVNGESLQKKVSKLGLTEYFTNISPIKDLTREQAATIYIKAYSNTNGVETNSLNPSSVIVIEDAGNISKVHYKNVENSIALGIMQCNSSSSFEPAGYVTRAEFITSMLKAIGK